MPNIRRDGKTIDIVCVGCGEHANVRAYYDYTPKFCSISCSNKTHNPKRNLPNKHCTVKGCVKPIYVGTLCQMHTWRKKHYGDVNHYRYQKYCNVKGCDRPHAKVGFCELHYRRMKRRGTTDDPVRLIDTKRYRQKKLPNHPLALNSGRVFIHRVVLYDKLGDGGHPCHWCGTIVYWNKSYPKDKDALLVDHLDHDRHNNHPDNLVPACNSCNSKRRRNSRSQALICTRPNKLSHR